MSTSKEPIFSALRRAQQEENADVLSDPRWDAYAQGSASEEDLAALRALAEKDPLAREALDAFAPFDGAQVKRFEDAVAPLPQATAATAQEPSLGAKVVSLDARRSRPSRMPMVLGALALAAAAAFIFVPRGDPESPAFPAYSLIVEGAVGERSDNAPLALSPGGRLAVTLRPASAASLPVTARAYVVQGQSALVVEGKVDVSDDGAARFEGRLPQALSLGNATLVVIVGGPGAVAAVSVDTLESLADSAQLRVFHRPLVLGAGP